MSSLHIKTQITINAPASTVWKVLSESNKYPEWNPFITRLSGPLEEGNKLQITAGGMKFSPVVLVSKKNEELRWLGKLLFQGLFDGEHSFVIDQQTDGSVVFYHEERFSGILVGLFRRKLETETKQGFEEMNQRLKERCEGIG